MDADLSALRITCGTKPSRFLGILRVASRDDGARGLVNVVGLNLGGLLDPLRKRIDVVETTAKKRAGSARLIRPSSHDIIGIVSLVSREADRDDSSVRDIRVAVAQFEHRNNDQAFNLSRIRDLTRRCRSGSRDR